MKDHNLICLDFSMDSLKKLQHEVDSLFDGLGT